MQSFRSIWIMVMDLRQAEAYSEDLILLEPDSEGKILSRKLSRDAIFIFRGATQLTFLAGNWAPYWDASKSASLYRGQFWAQNVNCQLPKLSRDLSFRIEKGISVQKICCFCTTLGNTFYKSKNNQFWSTLMGSASVCHKSIPLVTWIWNLVCMSF